MLQKLARDPLVHFVAAAILIFCANHFLRGADARDDTIRLSRGDVERLAALYATETGAAPGPEELRSLVADQVETLALAREAKRLGLAEGDVIVERRLAQKMRFMVDDLAEPGEPGEAELRSWYEINRSSLEIPARYSFDHVYFREADLERARGVLGRLQEHPDADWLAQGDAFMLQRQYGQLPAQEIARLFGTEFAGAIVTLPADGEWRGPVGSALGLHLVRVTQASTAVSPDFDEIRQTVLDRWRRDARQAANAKAVSEIVKKYKVEIEGVDP